MIKCTRIHRHRWVAVAALLLAATSTVFSPPGAAQSTNDSFCLTHDDLVSHLTQRFGERRVSIAATTGGALIELFVSQSGSWTILGTMPGGPTCVVATGDYWEWIGMSPTRSRPTGKS